MKLLLDTNALLWLLGDDDRLSRTARSTIEQSSEIAISEVSLWEIAIKVSIGKLAPLPRLSETLGSLGFKRLHLNDDYLQAYTSLPLIHRDPFDRMLVSQAKVDDYTLVTSDEILSQYDITVVTAA